MNINRLFAVSALLNLALVAVAGIELFYSKAAPESVPMTQLSPPPVAESIRQESNHSITWREIASADYPVYIKNLRSLGCPERTIRWIIASDMSMGNQSGATEQHKGQSAAEPVLTNVQENQLRQLTGSPESTVNVGQTYTTPATEVSGSEPDMSTHRSASTSKTTAGVTQEQGAVAQMPLAFVMQSDAGTNLEPEQKSALQSLQKNFIDQVGGANQNPADPAYLTRWAAAQPTSDEIFHSQFGDAAYGHMLWLRANQTGNFQQ